MSRSRRPRTPQLAESLFETACQAAGLVANRSHDDQFGWDFLVQFPSQRRGGPADLDLPGATCLIQVKSSRIGRTASRLKLSNALRFAQEPIPCFLVLLTFEGDAPSPSAAYVRHIWTDDIGGALKTARQAHAAGDAELHRRNYTIRFSDVERCDLSDVPTRIEAAVGALGSDYASRKTAFASTVGYENGYAVGTFTFDEDVDDEAFVDLMLGRVEELPVSHMVIQEHRFGLPGLQTIEDMPGRLSVAALPEEPCQVVVGAADGDGELTLDGELFVPGVPGLSEALFKIRVQTRSLELILRPGSASTLNLSYDADAPMTIGALAELATLWSWVNAGEITVGLWVRGKLVSHGSIQLQANSPAVPWRRLAKALARLLAFIPERRWPPEARFTIRDLMGGLADIETFAGQVSLPGMRIGIANTPLNFLELAGRCTRFLAPAYLDFGSATLFAVIEAPIERLERQDDGYALVLGTPKPLRRAALAGDARTNLDFMREHLTAVREERGGGGDVLLGTLGAIEEIDLTAA